MRNIISVAGMSIMIAASAGAVSAADGDEPPLYTVQTYEEYVASEQDMIERVPGGKKNISISEIIQSLFTFKS